MFTKDQEPCWHEFRSKPKIPRTRLSLEDILPENRSTYDKMVPPKVDGEPTKVFFHVTVMSIDSVNENSMSYGNDLDIYSENTVSSLNLQTGMYSGTFATDIFFAQTWKDHRLRLPANMTKEYRLLDLDWLDEIWRPDSFFKNAKEVNFQTMTIPNHYMWLYQDFTILYMVKLTLTLSCAMNFAIYPHDTQECNMQMESLSHTTDDLVFVWDPQIPLVVDEGIELPQQMILSNTTAECTQVYSTGNFTCLEVVFKLKRRLGHFLFHTYLPTCLIVIMSWVSFWIRPEIAPARVTLGVTSLLTLSTQHAKSQAALPPVTYMKAIDVFMSSCTVFVFMALMEYAVVSILLDDENTKKKQKRLKIPPPPPPPNLSALKCDSAFLKEMGGRIPENILRFPSDPSSNQAYAKNLEAKARRARALMMDRGSRYIFPISFTVLNCIYWITFWQYL
ncbi:glycine receptor subunit alpha-2-like isoform X2 [Macrobrachium nipponense]|uniref:glycine receptor subunit alpha-2-like isoform X2 n=1 Tax=Macrobrachium nipponense TaxID=159736 RepID=UPI0030C89F89